MSAERNETTNRGNNKTRRNHNNVGPAEQCINERIQRDDERHINDNSDGDINGVNNVDELFHEATTTATTTIASTIKYTIGGIGDLICFTTESLRELRWYYRIMGILYLLKEIIILYKTL